VADVGCGHGHSTLQMAQPFPNSRFFGFDTHAGSIEAARPLAGEAGVADRVQFAVARATCYPDHGFGLICFFDVLHDLGDPIAAAQHAARTPTPGGTVMLVEPFAHDRAEDNHNAIGQLYYGGSTMICCAHAIAEGGKLVLGAQAGPKRLGDVFRRAGLAHFRVAAETPFKLVCEARR
jgi:ubiquinone/menaquinone biosynthesis C-methylase UbiE